MGTVTVSGGTTYKISAYQTDTNDDVKSGGSMIVLGGWSGASDNGRS